jgi:hypothetical protein
VVSGRSDPRFQSIEVLFILLNAELSEPLRLRIRLRLRFHKGIVSSSIVIINTWTFDAGLGLNSRWTGETVSRVKDAVSLAEGASSGIVAWGTGLVVRLSFSLHGELSLFIEWLGVCGVGR